MRTFIALFLLMAGSLAEQYAVQGFGLQEEIVEDFPGWLMLVGLTLCLSQDLFECFRD